MFDCGSDVNSYIAPTDLCNGKLTLLHKASHYCQVEVVRLLVHREADINIRCLNKHTVLHLAAISGNVEILKILLDKGMPVNLTAENDRTPLHL
jgi:ankyrin repeat protein